MFKSQESISISINPSLQLLHPLRLSWRLQPLNCHYHHTLMTPCACRITPDRRRRHCCHLKCSGNTAAFASLFACVSLFGKLATCTRTRNISAGIDCACRVETWRFQARGSRLRLAPPHCRDAAVCPLTCDCSNMQATSRPIFTCGPTPPSRVYSWLKNLVTCKLPSISLNQPCAQHSHCSVSMLYYVAAVRAVYALLQLNIQREASRTAAPTSS